HVGVVFGFGIESEVWLFRLPNFPHNDRTFVPGVGNDQPNWLFESALHNVDADLLVVFEFQLIQSWNRSQKSDATARNDTFFHSSPGRVHRIFDARLLFLHFRLGRLAFRRSPKPGAFTAAACSVPRSLFTTSVASASPSMSSAIINRERPIFATCSRIGRRSFIVLIFFS